MQIRSILTLSALLFAVFQSSAAATRFVSPGGDDQADCSTALAPCRTLGRAVAVAGSGDTIRLAGGIYTGKTAIAATGALALTIQGAWSADFTTRDMISFRTALRGGKTDRALRITATGTADLAVTIDGLTIERSKAKTPDGEGEASGGGLLAESFDLSTLTLDLSNVTIGGNKSSHDGGGLRIFSGGSSSLTATLTSCTVTTNKSKGEGAGAEVDARDSSTLTMTLLQSIFTLNKAKDGGGAIDAEADEQATLSLTARRSLFIRNAASHEGGALNVYGVNSGGAHLTLENTIFVGNTSKQDGGAVEVRSRDTSSATLDSRNNTLTANTAKGSGGGTNVEADPGSIGVSATIVNDILWGNRGENDLHASGVAGGSANWCVIGTMSPGFTSSQIISADPMLVNGPGGDWHLLPGSPAVDAGTCVGAPAVDYDGTARPQGGGCDIGADER